MVKQIIEFLRLDVETEKTMRSTKNLVLLVSLILMLCSFVMSIMNAFKASWLMLISTVVLSVIFFVCCLICLIRYNHRIMACILGCTIIGLFSFYLIIGGNAGFSIDWILLVPVAYTTLFGVRAGLLVGGYFWIFIFVCLWSPVNNLLPYTYPDEVKMRFPILYTCGFLLAIVIGVRRKKMQIDQMKYELHLSNAVATERGRVERISLDAVSSICHALDARDPYTKKHSDHVAEYSQMIAKSCGWDDKKLELLVRAAKVHDLGKIGTPDAILKKSGPLDEEEFSIMKQHVAVGAQIAAEFISMPELAVGAQYHHERYDGKGYLDGLKGDEIPIEGRIIGIADAIDAMSSDRIYRKKRSKESLIKELNNGAGLQFDPKMVEVALNLIENGMIEEVNKN